MAIPKVITATEEDKELVLGTLGLAFVEDPFARWLFPNGQSYLKNFAEMGLAIAGKAFENETAFYTEDQSAAALWLPPGVETDGEVAGKVVEEMFEGELRDNLLEVLGEMDAYHPHDEPCWYLSFLGVDISKQGEGRGALLIKDTLKRCDDEGMLAYLESTNPQNISFYERHGFEIMGQINCGNPEPMQPMIRTPR